jgi:hypothetical protein
MGSVLISTALGLLGLTLLLGVCVVVRGAIEEPARRNGSVGRVRKNDPMRPIAKAELGYTFLFRKIKIPKKPINVKECLGTPDVRKRWIIHPCFNFNPSPEGDFWCQHCAMTKTDFGRTWYSLSIMGLLRHQILELGDMRLSPQFYKSWLRSPRNS